MAEPTAPHPPEIVPFPWLQSLIPIALSAFMASLLEQPLLLLMGALAPMMVAGGWWEARRRAVRKWGKDQDKHAADLLQHRADLEAAREKVRLRAQARNPPLREAVKSPLWQPASLITDGVRLGTGWTECETGSPLQGTGPISDMPITLSLTQGVAVVGGEECAEVWRIIATAWLLAGDEPLGAHILASGALPRDIDGVSRAVWVGRIEDVPSGICVMVKPKTAYVVDIISQSQDTIVVYPDRLTLTEALSIIQHYGVPQQPQGGGESRDYSRRDQLWASLGEDQQEWDMVAQGPHTVLWGSTGSGKSVTLCALVSGLALRYSPESLVCVLIDFKGGAGLRRLGRLPHVVGMMTDLAGSTVTRALTGIHAELLRRETICNNWAVADVSDLPEDVACPRLMIVIDEAAWLLSNHPEFSSVLSDVLARGRSLGVHVVISTQRITGVLTPAMMANVSLRMCGRVTDDSEVTAWMPDMSPTLRTRARHLTPGSLLMQGAQQGPHVREVNELPVEGIEGAPSSWRVWADPLPSTFLGDTASWGLLDDLPHATHRALTWEECPSGSVLVVGDRGMGRTSAARLLASHDSQHVSAPSHPFEMWLWLRDAPLSDTIILDDLDNTLEQAGTEGSHVLIECLSRLRARLIITSRAQPQYLRMLDPLVEQTISLSVSKPENKTLLQAENSRIPGRIRWEGRTIQLALPPRAPHNAPAVIPELSSGAAVLTRDPESWKGYDALWRGSPEELAAQWNTLPEGVTVALDAIGPLEARLASAGRIVLPPIGPPAHQLVLWDRGTFRLSQRVWRKD